MEEEVPIKYQHLEDQLLYALDKNHPPVFKSDLKILIGLELYDCHLDELGFLEHCENLEKLTFHNNIRRRPLQILPPLPKLKELGIIGESVKNLSFLAQCPNLEKLYLHSCGPVDISSINYLIQLRKLSLESINIRGFEKLSQMDTVVELYLQDIFQGDIPFRKFPNVKELSCRGVDFRNFAVLFA